MELTVNTGGFGRMFGVPNDVVDYYIKLADEKQLKVLLYYLRHSGENINSKIISENLNIGEKDVENAVAFWQNTSIFSNQKTPVKVRLRQDSKANFVGRESMLDKEEALRMRGSSDGVQEVLKVAEASFGRPLNSDEIQLIGYICNDVGLPSPVIITLIKYCEINNHKNMKYIKKKAETWKERGIVNLEKADEEIKEQTDLQKFYNYIQKTFRLIAPLVDDQKKIAIKWFEKKYNMELIRRAYEISVSKINQINFKYINTVLENWEKAGIKKVSDLDSSNEQNRIIESDTYFSNDVDKFKEFINNF